MLVFDQRQHVSYSAVFSDGFSRGVPFCRCLNSVDYSLKLSALSRKLIKKKKKKNMWFAPLFFLLVILFCIMFLCYRIFNGESVKKPCYRTNWKLLRVFKKIKNKNAALTCFDKEINLLPVILVVSLFFFFVFSVQIKALRVDSRGRWSAGVWANTAGMSKVNYSL